MRELTVDEIQATSGGVRTGLRWAITELTKGYFVNAALGGFGKASSSSRSWGVVGPGSFDATNASSLNAVNGADRESDDYSRRMTER